MLNVPQSVLRKEAFAVPTHELRPFVHRFSGYGASDGDARDTPGASYYRTDKFDAEMSSGDYRLAEDPDALDETPNEPYVQPAGYDLNGIGGEPLHDEVSIPQGRLTRRARPLMTHEGQEMYPSDYRHPGERGFRYRAKFPGV